MKCSSGPFNWTNKQYGIWTIHIISQFGLPIIFRRLYI